MNILSQKDTQSKESRPSRGARTSSSTTVAAPPVPTSPIKAGSSSQLLHQDERGQRDQHAEASIAIHVTTPSGGSPDNPVNGNLHPSLAADRLARRPTLTRTQSAAAAQRIAIRPKGRRSVTSTILPGRKASYFSFPPYEAGQAEVNSIILSEKRARDDSALMLQPRFAQISTEASIVQEQVTERSPSPASSLSPASSDPPSPKSMPTLRHRPRQPPLSVRKSKSREDLDDQTAPRETVGVTAAGSDSEKEEAEEEGGFHQSWNNHGSQQQFGFARNNPTTSRHLITTGDGSTGTRATNEGSRSTWFTRLLATLGGVFAQTQLPNEAVGVGPRVRFRRRQAMSRYLG